MSARPTRLLPVPCTPKHGSQRQHCSSGNNTSRSADQTALSRLRITPAPSRQRRRFFTTNLWIQGTTPSGIVRETITSPASIHSHTQPPTPPMSQPTRRTFAPDGIGYEFRHHHRRDYPRVGRVYQWLRIQSIESHHHHHRTEFTLTFFTTSGIPYNRATYAPQFGSAAVAAGSSVTQASITHLPVRFQPDAAGWIVPRTGPTDIGAVGHSATQPTLSSVTITPASVSVAGSGIQLFYIATTAFSNGLTERLHLPRLLGHHQSLFRVLLSTTFGPISDQDQTVRETSLHSKTPLPEPHLSSSGRAVLE